MSEQPNVGPILVKRLRANALEPLTLTIEFAVDELFAEKQQNLLAVIVGSLERAYLEGLRDGFVQSELEDERGDDAGGVDARDPENPAPPSEMRTESVPLFADRLPDSIKERLPSQLPDAG